MGEATISKGKAALARLPEPGQLVEVRGRRFVVADAVQSSLPETAGRDGGLPQTRVTLSSVEDDALGETLTVIWETELGARVFEKGELPEPSGFDNPEYLDGFLDAIRWGVASNADVRNLLSPFRSGIDIDDYQLEPLVRAMRMPRACLLLADAVGLGKTIEAGLVIQELILRNRVRTVLIVCPSSLQIKWRDEMREKFGLEFRIVDSALLKDLRRRRGIHVNPWKHFPRLITSIDYVKRDRPLRLLRDLLDDHPRYPRPFDMLVVDEAHNVAPAGFGQGSADSLKTQAIHTLVPNFEHRLFLTATPHNGYPESFSALLEMLDSQRYARGTKPNRDHLHGVTMVRRLKDDLPPGWDGQPMFPSRTIDYIDVPYTDLEREAHARLQAYARSRLDAATSGHSRFATEFVLKVVKKRLFSSPAAFAHTLAKHRQTVTKGPARDLGSGQPRNALLKKRLDELEEEFADDAVFQEAEDEAVDISSATLQPLSRSEKEHLDWLADWALDAERHLDSKARELVRWLSRHVKPNGTWCDERVVIFTEYRDTQRWLHRQLAAEGLAERGRLLMLYGGMDEATREKIKAAFQADARDSQVRILLATDAASEGIDLQRHCHKMIHYEIPWNPNRLEQRIGRIDRHGQRSNPEVYHFVPKGFRESRAETPGGLEADLEFIVRAAQKVDRIREDLGKVGSVIASQVEEAMLGRRDQLDTSTAERQSEGSRKLLRAERDAREEIRKFRERLDDTVRDLHLSPENIRKVVDIGLKLAGQPPLEAAVVQGVGSAFSMPALHGSWATCRVGLEHPHTRAVRPIVFDQADARGRDDVVLVHLNHRLVQMCLRLLRAEVWSTRDRKLLNRVTGKVVPQAYLPEPAIIAHGRLLVLGGAHHRIHEELIASGGFIREGRFARMNVGQVQTALEHAHMKLPSKTVLDQVAALWPKLNGPLFSSLDARLSERTENLDKLLVERSAKEKEDVTRILCELRETIQSAMRRPEQLELDFYGDSEKQREYVGALERRLHQIPDEIEQETNAVATRYANPQPRLFPVAVTVLIPDTMGDR